MKAITWYIGDIVKILNQRVENEFDGNIVISGDRGNGKSTLISKIFYRTGKFRPRKHQVYTREDVIKLLQTQIKGLCFDDEAVNSGYKRNFQSKAQQELIKIVTAFRDNFNIYASAIPNFFSLDKDLRDLVFMHIQVIERGIAVVHMPLSNLLYSQDKWDTKNNARKEQAWTNKIRKDPTFRPKYHQLTTFRGYLYFTDLTPKQKKLYKEIKKEKRLPAFATSEQQKEFTFNEKVYNFMISGKLTSDGLMQMCLLEGVKYSSVLSNLSRMLKDNAVGKKPGDFITSTPKLLRSNQMAQINSLVPTL